MLVLLGIGAWVAILCGVGYGMAILLGLMDTPAHPAKWLVTVYGRRWVLRGTKWLLGGSRTAKPVYVARHRVIRGAAQYRGFAS